MKRIALAPPTRRRIVKGAGALVAGIVAPALVGQRAARADYPDRPVKFVVANTPGGPSDIVTASLPRRSINRPAKLLSSKIGAELAAISVWNTWRAPIPMATRFC